MNLKELVSGVSLVVLRGGRGGHWRDFALRGSGGLPSHTRTKTLKPTSLNSPATAGRRTFAW